MKRGWTGWTLLGVLALALGAAAEWVETRPGAETGVRLAEDAGGVQRLVCEVAGFQSRDRIIDGAAWQEIRVPGAAITLEAGAPELPVLAAGLILPDRGQPRLTVVAAEHVDLLLRPQPSKGNLSRDIDPATVPWTFGPAYQAETWPRERAILREPYILRDYRGQTVVFQPFQYLPGPGILRVTTRLEVELRCEGGGGLNTLERQGPPETLDKNFAGIYAERFLNFTAASRYTAIHGQGRLLIICHDDFLDEMAPFVAWKRQKGLDVEMVPRSTAGATATAILAYVQAYYANPGLAALLLVGDAEQVPSPSHSGGSSDPTYAMLAGGDSYPDILVGRFSAATGAQVTTMVERCVEYERDPEAGATWYRAGTGIASAEGAGIGDDGESDIVHLNGIRADLLGYTYTTVDQIYDPGASAATVSAAVNQGRSVINYCGHGSVTSWGTTGFSNTHVNALTNENRLPFIVDVACVNGQFAGTTCFAEAWMRATRNGNPSGAVGIYASTINQSWAPPMAAQDECADLLAAEADLSFGAICFNGAMRMNDDYADYAMTRTWTLFTDPTLEVRTNTPLPLAVSHAAAMPSTQAAFPVQTGFPGARATLFGNGQSYGTAAADAAGLALVPLTAAPAAGQVLTLTVTGHNTLTYLGTVAVVAPAGPWVNLVATALDGDGLLTPAESTWLSLTVANVGASDAGPLSFSLSGAHPDLLSIGGSPLLPGGLPAGGTATLSDAFLLEVGPGLTDGEAILLTLTAADGLGGSWPSSFTLVAQVDPRAEVAPAALAFHARPGGTDTATLSIANTGHAPLHWSLGFAPDGIPHMDRSMAGSTISAAENSFRPGEPLTLHLSLFNGSPDNEWALGAALDLPAGAAAVSYTNFVVSGGGHLQADGVTGDGARLTWSDPDGGWGNIYPNETATATVELEVAADFSGDLTLEWQIDGDIYGGDPHSVTGTFSLVNEGPLTPPWCSFSPAAGTLAPGAQAQVAVTADAALLAEGTWTGTLILTHNDPNQGPLLLPVSFTVGGPPDAPALRILAQSNCQSRLEWDPVDGAELYRIWQSAGQGLPFSLLAETVETMWLIPCATPGTRLFRVTAATD